MVAILHKQETTICALLDIFIIILCRTYCPALWNKFNNILCQRPHIKESNKRSHGQFLLALAAYNPLWIVIIHLLVPSVLVYDYSIQPPCPIMFQSCWMNARTAVWDNFLNIFSPKQCPVEQGWSQCSLSSTPLFQNTYVLNISGHSPLHCGMRLEIAHHCSPPRCRFIGARTLSHVSAGGNVQVVTSFCTIGLKTFLKLHWSL